eukprot:gene29713-36499_t
MADASTIAVIGAGLMGAAIATRLIETGHRVTVFDVDAQKVAALVAKGAVAALSVAAATAQSRFVILSLNHADIVRTVVFGADGRGRIVMQHLCSNYTLMGPSGAGQTTKLINQLFCAVAFQAVAEAVKLAEAGGVDPALIPQALAGGRADNRIMQEFMAKFAARDYTPTGRIDNMLKDLDS